MLLFRSKEHAVEWAAREGMPAGALLTVEQVWELSKLWYGDRLAAEFSGRTTEEANEIFAQLDLNPDFWRFTNNG